MKTLRSFLARLRDLFRRKRMEAGLREDLDFHLSELEEKHKRRGLTAEEATAAARRELGNVTRVQEDFHEQAGFPLMEELARDFAVAWRGLAKRPVFSLSVVAILGLGLGIASTVQGLASAVFNRPLPVRNAEELHLVLLSDQTPSRLSRKTVDRLSADFGVDSVAGYTNGTRFAVRVGNQPSTKVSSQLVLGGFFLTLGVSPEAGRLLAPDDESSADKANVAVVSRSWAVRNFGSPENALGKEVLVNQLNVRIVGVAPSTFRGVLAGRTTDLWLPARVQPRLGYDANADITFGDDRPNREDWNEEERVGWIQAYLRLPAGYDLRAASTRVARAYLPQAEELAKTDDDAAEKERTLRRSFSVVPSPSGYSSFRTEYRATNAVLTAFVAVFLLLASANVSGLLLVRGLSRQKEIGVRLALGAKRWRIFFLFGAEAALLSAGGALLGLVLSSWLLPLAAHLLAPTQALGPLVVDVSLFAFVAVLTILIALFCSLLPSILLTRLQPQDAILGQGKPGRSPVAAGRVLVAGQLALAVVLVALAISLGKRFADMLTANPGFDEGRVLACDFDPHAGGYANEEIGKLKLRLESILLGFPQVESVSFADKGLVASGMRQSHLNFRGDDTRVAQDAFQTDAVRPGFFRTAGMVLLQGRDFDGGDRQGTPAVAVVTVSLAKRVFGSENVVGRRFGHNRQADSSDFTIVGVVADARINGLREMPPAMVFFSQDQATRSRVGSVIVRTRGGTAGLEQTLQEALARAEPGLVFSRWQTLSERLDDDLEGERGTSRLSYGFAFMSLLLASAGMCTLVAYLVNQRGREFAVRMAVGAAPGLILRTVVLDSLKLGCAGVLLGIVGACLLHTLPAAASRMPSTPDVFSSGLAAILCLVAIAISGFLPARRAAGTNPLQLLKNE